MHSLPLFHRIAGQAVIVLGEGPAAEAKRRLVERAGGIVADEDAPARLAFVAYEDLAADEAAAGRLRARGLLVNVADRPELCDFTVPSVLERDPVLIAVATGGASAGLAKALRLRLEALLPQALGGLARALGAGRGALRATWPDAAERRRALDHALAPGGPLDPLDEAAAGRVESWIAAAGRRGISAEPVEIVLRSANPDDLSVREARLLGAADVIVCTVDVPEAILARARADAERRAPGDPRPVRGAVVILRG